MTFECQRTQDDGLRRSVFFELVQDGDNIVVKVLGSCYRRNDAANLGEPAFTYENHAATPKTGMTNDANGYQLQKMLTIGPRSGSGSKLTFAVSDDLTLKAVSGGGVEVTFERGDPGLPVGEHDQDGWRQGAFHLHWQSPAACKERIFIWRQ